MSSDEAGEQPRGAAGPHPLLPALGSALLLWTTFPPADWSWFAWVAVAPLFLLVRSKRRERSVYFGAWAGGPSMPGLGSTGSAPRRWTRTVARNGTAPTAARSTTTRNVARASGPATHVVATAG